MAEAGPALRSGRLTGYRRSTLCSAGDAFRGSPPRELPLGRCGEFEYFWFVLPFRPTSRSPWNRGVPFCEGLGAALF